MEDKHNSNNNSNKPQTNTNKQSLEWREIKKLQDNFEKLNNSYSQLLAEKQSLDERFGKIEEYLSRLNESLTGIAKIDDLKQLSSQISAGNINHENSKSSYEYKLLFNRVASRAVLEQALNTAEKRLIMACPWLTTWATDIAKFEFILSKGVRIDIGWGSLEDLAQEQTDNIIWYGALPQLQQLQEQYPDLLHMKELGTHEKFLVCDESFAMLGSHNFLTSGSSSPEFEVGIFTKDPNIIDQLIEHFDTSIFDKQAAIEYLNREYSTYGSAERPIEISVLNRSISRLKNETVLQAGEDIIIEPISNEEHIYNTINDDCVSEDIVVHLNWKHNPSLVSRYPKYREPIDLDLCCLYELETGEKNAIQALGSHFGNYDESPYILLNGDDRTGNDLPEGESLKINSSKIDKFKRILIYTFIYNGVANWSEIDAILTIKQVYSPPIIVKLDNPNDNQTICAIALLTRINNTFKISNKIQYFSDSVEMDRYFNWGINWGPPEYKRRQFPRPQR
ncbi:phospholipase D-like domain-containing protein [Aphanizomenon flos-aquae NRERC-008]|jgi:tellurite resistance protein TerA|uniref:PLD phosphodiesterase domain-containing protein n=1 Tax=Aphanizomenon flos-aquae FACHB-1249 TaxID=2692889 RepID=A0ABR8IR71_APHFL|nr:MULTISPECIES: phospholipase D-like domain-containing protein [Aphanizomenon]MBD2390960.1 hypothetical protein [Aphanizomenon flos-aquae FACHB-1171]MBD2557332.1 hypothetical protein [Aphanizomenon flos-aquae FACHB-1290]MBD2631920.1 hypothetical protein [Aphanizomenon sp. FACHB-1399]MBD2642784.1 hypothetical protein [Aphanizomenon sp. FACHB-1401]MBD2657710.1 hypothetical protein [Aphanizomenon flos-aquae FACHB-1265]